MASAYHQYSFASSPWFPSFPVSPKMRSFRMGSRPFQNASAKHMRCSRSQIPASPSSLHRYARERACSCGKYSHARPSAL